MLSIAHESEFKFLFIFVRKFTFYRLKTSNKKRCKLNNWNWSLHLILPTHCDELPNSFLNLIDNQLQFLDGLKWLSKNLPLAKSLEQEVKLYIIHSWLSNILDLGKTLQLQVATPHLWTTNKDPKNKYLYGIFYINHIILITHKLCYQ